MCFGSSQKATRKELEDKLAIGQSDPELTHVVQSLEDTIRRYGGTISAGGSPGPVSSTASVLSLPIASNLSLPTTAPLTTTYVPVVQPTYTTNPPVTSSGGAASAAAQTSTQTTTRASAYHRAAF